MLRPLTRVWLVLALGAGSLVTSAVVATVPSGADAPELSSSPTACPLAHAPASPTGVPWLSAQYQSKYTPGQLAQQVANCEVAFHPSSTFLAELSIIGLNRTANQVYQNQNMWLADNSGTLTAQHDFASLGIPPLTLEDGPDGIIYKPPASQLSPTVFPNQLAVAASFDPTLAQQFGQQLGLESSTLRFMGVQAPDLNLDRIPNWGRMQETFGEDPLLAGTMGAAETIGILQNSHVVVLKHFGVYGQETSRRSVNATLSTNALYDTYVRAFALTTEAVAHSSSVPAARAVAIMCSYGDVNGARSCIAPVLTSALSTLQFSGLVRSDLDTVTTTPALLRNGLSLIKPLDAQVFQPTSSVSAQNKSLVRLAALRVLATMFRAGLVTPTQLSWANHPGALSKSQSAAGNSLANIIEGRAAVLLKNGAVGVPGSLPIVKSSGTVALIAPSTLATTCQNVAARVASYAGTKVTCTIWNAALAAPTVLMNTLPAASRTHPRTYAVKWVAPSSGPFLVDTTTYGDSSLDLNGVNLQNQPGISENYGQHHSTITVVKGHVYDFKESWQSVGPYLTIRALAPGVAVAVAAAKKAQTAVILANDYAAEGSDLDQLNLPDGQDAVIAAVAAVVPTSVALLTTGPVLMPWLSSVKSVVELWNPGRMPPFDDVMNNFVLGYSAVLDGHVSPSGRLPITFPADPNQSPMSMGTGPSRFSFWPGIGGQSNLNLSPLNGTVIGYGWYQQQGWPVLFPFGFGLTYATMTTRFAASNHCATPDTSTSICLPVAVRLTNDVARPASTAVQVYVAQPSTTLAPRPRLVLGSVAMVNCRAWQLVTPSCVPGAMTPTTITSLGVGAWSPSSSSYQFLSGCYSFVVAEDAAQAFSALANPSAYPGHVVSATAPFSASTTLTAGGCPA